MNYFLSSTLLFYLDYFLYCYLHYWIYKELLLYCKTSVLNRTRYLPKFNSTSLLSLSYINGLPDSASEGTAHMLRPCLSWSCSSSSAMITASINYHYIISVLLVLTLTFILYIYIYFLGCRRPQIFHFFHFFFFFRVWEPSNLSLLCWWGAYLFLSFYSMNCL